MEETLSRATQAPKEVHGFMIHPITVQDIGYFEEHFRDKMIEMLGAKIESMTWVVDPDKKTEIYQQEYDTILTQVRFSNPEWRQKILDYINSVDGCYALIWLSLKKGNPGLKREVVGELMDDDQTHDIITALLDISGLKKYIPIDDLKRLEDTKKK